MAVCGRFGDMKTFNVFAQLVVLVSLPLFLGGCSGDKKEPGAEVKPVEEKEQEIKEEMKSEEYIALQYIFLNFQ